MAETINSETPAKPPPNEPQFANVDKAVMRGGECVAVACSANMAQRIARALNRHKTNRRGV